MSASTVVPMLHRLRFGHWLALDCVGALLLVRPLEGSPGPHVFAPLWWVVSLLLTAAAAARRLHPVMALGVVVVLSAATGWLAADGTSAVAFVLVFVAITRSDRLIAAGLAVSAAVAVVNWTAIAWVSRVVARPGPVSMSHLVTELATLVGAVVIGYAIRQSRRYAQGLRQQAEDAAEARAAEARRAVVEERLRIAREMHDIVAHSMSLIAVRAELGTQVVRVRPEQAEPTLASVAEISRSALRDMRRLLGVLRNPDGSRADPALRPAPGLADLPDLVSGTAEAGVPVDLQVRGEWRELPAGTDLTAYRIVQEALTNVVRHAGAHRATVRLTYRAAALGIEITDRGPAVPSTPDTGVGHGLTGMRERVALYGGTLDAGPLAGGGFRVAASLPLDAAVAA